MGLLSRVNYWRVTHRRGLGPLLLHSKWVDGEVQSQIGNGGELVCRPGRASVAVDKATVAGKTIVVVYAVAATGKTTTAIDVVVVAAAAAAAAAAGEFVVPAGATMMALVDVVQTGIFPLSQPRWHT